MDTWTLQMGFPVISVTRINTTHIYVKQEKYSLDSPDTGMSKQNQGVFSKCFPTKKKLLVQNENSPEKKNSDEILRIWKHLKLITHFTQRFYFYTSPPPPPPLKTSKKENFSDIFTGYKNGTLE